MTLDGLGRDRQLGGDVSVRVAACDESRRRALALGPLTEFGVHRGEFSVRACVGERVEDESREARRKAVRGSLTLIVKLVHVDESDVEFMDRVLERFDE